MRSLMDSREIVLINVVIRIPDSPFFDLAPRGG